ncbi:hypothetical protein PRIPAC_88424 [Pristionchus pacificus]|uniref:Uncharacterized protein n=1 Tax=Pristionchus pacificus TaxID=54126 RepID=A0A2A6B6L3_PRIPA|nr:hypothetical protein PRIPAC_88424 [Pristionchus pacificus]|eukprot:PDM61516.1 hypothetical protein PRIPAC_50958 [Pristionchus pacificus]
MGIFYSKPISSRRNFDRDSVILCDGHNRLQKPKFAGTPNGRFVFILGNMHVTSDGYQDDSQDLAISFQLDVIDLFLSKRTRIGNISDFYNFGHPTGFYSLNEGNVVLVDYDPFDKTLRQRLIQIDMIKETAECVFYRGYEVNLESLFHLQTSTGEANVHVRQFYETGEAGEAGVSTFHPPFFIKNTVLGFFIDPNCVDDLIDPMKVLFKHIVHSRGQYTVYTAVFLWSWNWRRLGGLCIQASMRMLYLRAVLLEPKTEKFIGFGTLNTRTLEWSEIKATMWNEEETNLIPLKDGHFLVTSMTSEKAQNRIIGLDILAQQKMERFRIIGNPQRMCSLALLSSIAVQKNDRIPSELLEQIAARMIAC